MSRTHQCLNERYAFMAWTLLLFLSIIAGLLAVEWAENKRYLENQRRSVVEQLSTIRARLEGEINAELLLARSIIAEVEINSDITKERFYKIARHFMAASRHIRNIGLAKGTVLTFVYPTEGYEKAVGLDYTKIATQWPAIQRVIKEGKAVVAGPLSLMQGGVGIIGRTPIYIGTGPEAKEYYGILSVVINLPSLLSAAGLDNEALQLMIALRGKDGLGAKGAVFHGPGDLFASDLQAPGGDPILMDVSLPGGSWQMASVPANSWKMSSPQNIYYRIIATAVGLVIVFLLIIQKREINSRRRAEEERNKVIDNLQAALSKVKQLSGLLPICSSCKKIRDDKGYWNQIESYIQDHSDAEFSHSICQECAKRLYPDIELDF